MTRPAVLKWHGAKSYLADFIISHMPPHTLYREPFFGGGAVLFRKPCEGIGEAVNDRNGELTNFWRTIRDQPEYGKFQSLIDATPFSQTEWEEATQCQAANKVYNAVSFFIRYRQSRQGLGKDYATPTTRTRRGMNENVSAWLSAVEGLPEAHARLKRVEICNMDFAEFIRKYDAPHACFYCDPPYLHETRTATDAYEHEMSVDDHKRLLTTLGGIKGTFVLSGYHSILYHEWALAGGYRIVEKQIDNKASGAKSKEKKTECLWIKD